MALHNSFLQHLLVRHRCRPPVVEFEPPGIPVRFNESIALSTVEVTGVYTHIVEFVLPEFSLVCSLVEEVVKVDLEGEREGVIDLRGKV